MKNDIRMRVVDFDVVRKFIADLPNSWIYIKLHNRYEGYSAGFYSKFKVRNVNDTDNSYCLIFGNEDDDRLTINWEQIIQTEMTFEGDEVLVRNKNIDIYIKKYNPSPGKVYEIPSIQKNLIITEGKTDWKIMKAALSYYNENGKFINPDISFLEYEDEFGAGNTTMATVRDYNAILPNDSLRIFVFDADNEKINKEHAGKRYAKMGNNVYSFVLPIPDHRKDTPLISIENLFTDEEIKTEYNGRRLFMAKEFDKSGKNLVNPRIMTLETKQTSNHIIDHKVYDVGDASVDLKDLYEYSKQASSIALSKNDFAECVLYRRSGFEKFDFSSFDEVFKIIEEIYWDYYNCRLNRKELGNGITLEDCGNGFYNLYLNVSFPQTMIESFAHGGMGVCQFKVDKEKKKYKFIFSISLKNGGSQIQSFVAEESDELLEFLINKGSNEMNRIIVNIFFQNTKELFSSYEILKAY